MFFFSSDLIISVPTYQKTDFHKHAMLHVILSEENLTVETPGRKDDGRLIFIGQEVIHKVTIRSKNTLLLFIDPSTAMADQIIEKYLKGEDFVCSDHSNNLDVKSASQTKVIEQVKQFIEDLNFSRGRGRISDERIGQILKRFDDRIFLLKTVDEIARESYLSTSRLSHLFKKETNMRLKNWLLMNKLKMVYLDVEGGKSLTNAAMDMGFADSAHLSKVAKRLTGISITTYFKS